VRATRNIAFDFTAICLGRAVVTLLGSTTFTISTGATSSTVDCGSPAFPRSLIDFDSPDDAANCAGQTPAALPLYAVLLAGLGLGAIAVTSRSASSRRARQRPDARDPAAVPNSP
jgi:hypothetical protein